MEEVAFGLTATAFTARITTAPRTLLPIDYPTGYEQHHIPNLSAAKEIPIETEAEYVQRGLYETISRLYAAALRLGSTK